MGEHGLARAGLAGEHVEPGREAQLGPLDEQEVLDAQFGEHDPRSTSATRRNGRRPRVSCRSYEDRRPNFVRRRR